MQINKSLIGNLIVLLADRCKPLYHTKLLKLLYLIDEESVTRTGAPITWLDYNVWELGPVSEDVYYSKLHGNNKFTEFVHFENAGENKYIIKAIVDFDDSDFSDLDLEIIDNVLSKHGKMNTGQLVAITHAKGSLWEKTKVQKDVRFSDDNKTSSIPLNFVDLIKNDDFKKSLYYMALENVGFQATLK